MATAGDKADAGHNHLRYMLSSWFDSSKDDTWIDSAPMMADQKKPETEVRQEEVRAVCYGRRTRITLSREKKRTDNGTL